MNTNELVMDDFENITADWDGLPDADKWHLIAQIEAMLAESAA